MNFSLLVLAVAAFTSFSAIPTADDVSVAMQSEDHIITLWKLVRLLAAATTSPRSPTCCASTVCMCAGSRIYYLNKDNQNRGLHGCDPHWGYVGTVYTSNPSSYCRIASDDAVEKDGDDGPVENIEAFLLE
ncbi:hypothetical protein CGCSCA1_v007941 [Colletotrichum siamense]|nr:hypothetical protein CGCSCA1_v007941 [Colletotrichum siamense]